MAWSRRTLLAASMIPLAGSSGAMPFPDKLGQRRLFLIFAPDDEHVGLKQMRAQTRTANFTRRDLDLVEVVDAEVRVNGEPVSAPSARELREVYEVAGGTFAVRLIGKDGTVKLARSGAVPITDVYDLIDSMPMRQQEMRERGEAAG